MARAETGEVEPEEEREMELMERELLTELEIDEGEEKEHPRTWRVTEPSYEGCGLKRKDDAECRHVEVSDLMAYEARRSPHSPQVHTTCQVLRHRETDHVEKAHPCS